jgi:glycosyltransferase involved in cell wall biosynthesis
MKAVRYIVISPVRNEQEFLEGTIRSLVSQTIRPVLWIIVDDGSTDATGRMADEATLQNSWIRVVHRKDRGVRRAGSGVMEAFNDGYKLVDGQPWDYLVKLDGDVTLEPNYFERCFAAFDADSRLGIAGGLVCNLIDGELRAESKNDPVFHVRGATKIYKQQCWQAIDGLFPVTGWDTLDELKANMLGWNTRTLADVKFIHHRPAGGAYGTWPNWVKNGYANYVTGYHPLFMLLKCAKRIFEKPYGIAALGLWTGFCSGYIKRLPQIDDVQLIRFLRQEQMKRLLRKSSLWG